MATVTIQPQLTNRTSAQSTRVPEDLALWRVSVEQYHAMIESGALDEDAQIELLEGWLVEKMSKSPAHTLSTNLVLNYLREIVPSDWMIRSQEPITLSDSEPEPDVCVIKGQPRQFAITHPDAKAVSLVVEVADSSLGRDRGSKKRVYAKSGIPVYWIVNLVDRWVEVYTDPLPTAQEPEYRTHCTYGIDEQLPVTIDGVESGLVYIRDLLP